MGLLQNSALNCLRQNLDVVCAYSQLHHYKVAHVALSGTYLGLDPYTASVVYVVNTGAIADIQAANHNHFVPMHCYVRPSGDHTHAHRYRYWY